MSDEAKRRRAGGVPRSGIRQSRGRLHGRVHRVDRLEASTRQALWFLFRRYYAGVSRADFERDLDKKTDIILLRDRDGGGLAGFSTLVVWSKVVQGRPVTAVFSGDTVIDARYWGQTALQRSFLGYIMRVWARRPRVATYWFLISKGYRTYLLLSRNFPEYWPRYDAPTPGWQTAVIDALARDLYPQAWRPERGILEFSASAGRLRDGVAPIEEPLLGYPDIRFFVERNPGHVRGDELCCIGRVDTTLARSYLSKIGWRALRRALRAGSRRGR